MGDEGKGRSPPVGKLGVGSMRGHETTICPLCRDLQEGKEATGADIKDQDMQEIKGGWGRRRLTGRWPWCLHWLSLQELQSAQVFSKISRHRARFLLSSQFS